MRLLGQHWVTQLWWSLVAAALGEVKQQSMTESSRVGERHRCMCWEHFAKTLAMIKQGSASVLSCSHRCRCTADMARQVAYKVIRSFTDMPNADAIPDWNGLVGLCACHIWHYGLHILLLRHTFIA